LLVENLASGRDKYGHFTCSTFGSGVAVGSLDTSITWEVLRDSGWKEVPGQLGIIFPPSRKEARRVMGGVKADARGGAFVKTLNVLNTADCVVLSGSPELSAAQSCQVTGTKVGLWARLPLLQSSCVELPAGHSSRYGQNSQHSMYVKQMHLYDYYFC